MRVVGPVQRGRRRRGRRATGTSRPRGHRVSAWASPQSAVVERSRARRARRRGRGALRRRRSAAPAVLGWVRRRRRRARVLAGPARSPARPRALPPRRMPAAGSANGSRRERGRPSVRSRSRGVRGRRLDARRPPGSRKRARVRLQARDAGGADRGRAARPGGRRAHAAIWFVARCVLARRRRVADVPQDLFVPVWPRSSSGTSATCRLLDARPVGAASRRGVVTLVASCRSGRILGRSPATGAAASCGSRSRLHGGHLRDARHRARDRERRPESAPCCSSPRLDDRLGPVRPAVPWAPVAIMVTYHLGQAGLVARCCAARAHSGSRHGGPVGRRRSGHGGCISA